jgi:hypothetical protein
MIDFLTYYELWYETMETNYEVVNVADWNIHNCQYLHDTIDTTCCGKITYNGKQLLLKTPRMLVPFGVCEGSVTKGITFLMCMFNEMNQEDSTFIKKCNDLDAWLVDMAYQLMPTSEWLFEKRTQYVSREIVKSRLRSIIYHIRESNVYDRMSKDTTYTEKPCVCVLTSPDTIIHEHNAPCDPRYIPPMSYVEALITPHIQVTSIGFGFVWTVLEINVHRAGFNYDCLLIDPHMLPMDHHELIHNIASKNLLSEKHT